MLITFQESDGGDTILPSNVFYDVVRYYMLYCGVVSVKCGVDSVVSVKCGLDSVVSVVSCVECGVVSVASVVMSHGVQGTEECRRDSSLRIRHTAAGHTMLPWCGGESWACLGFKRSTIV